MNSILDSAKSKYSYSLILLRQLVITEFKLRYQGSVLGYLWSLLKPLFLFTILYFVFVHFLKIGAGIPDWPVALLMGIILWTFFSEVTNNGLSSVISRGDVIRKINFPKYVIVFASSISALINLSINLLIVGIFMVISGVDLTQSALLTPLYILLLFAFGLGLAFILSTLYVRLRDTNHIWEIMMQALFYGSAVIYPITMVIDRSEALAGALLLNPIAYSIQEIRHAFINPVNPTLTDVTGEPLLQLIPIGITILVFIFGAWYFKRNSKNFAEDI